jgi:uncharacterized SAM-binding protein YcdF (DUF218 family)
MNHELKRSDCILVLGSHDLRVAERGAQLFLDGWASLLIISGGLGNITRNIWDEPEADKFARIAINAGVPKDRILVENRSSNTGDNIIFTRRLLDEKGIKVNSFIVVQKPYMERRAYATFRKIWPEKSVVVTSPQISFRDYPTREISMDAVINIMVGDLQRIMIYPDRGYQIPQEIPDDVMEAYKTLVELGYTNHMVE